jgi:hypothetical protein
MGVRALRGTFRDMETSRGHGDFHGNIEKNNIFI